MPLVRSDFGRGEYLMTVNISGIRSIYDTATHEDFDISRLHHGIMGNFTREGITAAHALRKEVEDAGGMFRLTDMFRTWDMQTQAHHDYITGKKRALSPPPGESFHNAARSEDIDIDLIEETLQPPGTGKKGFALYWEMCRDLGFTGVVRNRYTPDKDATEAWHIDYMGIFKALYNRQGYKAAAIAATMDAIGNNFVGESTEYVKNMRIQAYLLHLGLLKQDVTGLWNNVAEVALKDYLGGSGGHSEFNLVLKHYKIETTEKNNVIPMHPKGAGSINFVLVLRIIFKWFFKFFKGKEK